MKILLIVAFGICSVHVFSQPTSNNQNSVPAQLNKKLANDSLLGKLSGVLINQSGATTKVDTSLKILYHDKKVNDVSNLAIFVNGKFLHCSLLSGINVNEIDSLTMTNDSLVIDSIVYNGQVRIKTKHPFNSQPISLQTLKEKYTNLKNKSSIFMIDGVIINEESNNYFVDETNLLRIIIEPLQKTKENVDLVLIKILTKTEANINDLKTIRIRGTE